MHATHFLNIRAALAFMVFLESSYLFYSGIELIKSGMGTNKETSVIKILGMELTTRTIGGLVFICGLVSLYFVWKLAPKELEVINTKTTQETSPTPKISEELADVPPQPAVTMKTSYTDFIKVNAAPEEVPINPQLIDFSYTPVSTLPDIDVFHDIDVLGENPNSLKNPFSDDEK
ncbi:MAG: hypothetical protein JKY45_05660 [Emcibacter sp.]|nr:hypothetical protein [Emcibacter sp.]